MINTQELINIRTEIPQCLDGHISEHGHVDMVFTSQPPSAQMVRLDFLIQQQLQSNWCWAAVATSVGNYYYGSGSFNQCSVASAELSRDCCSQPAPCNIYGYLETALMQTRSFHRMVEQKIQLAAIKNEINSKRPIGLRCAWDGGGAHFLVIHGYDGERILAADSIYGYGLYALSAFPKNYYGGGRWTHTYYTKKNQERA